MYIAQSMPPVHLLLILIYVLDEIWINDDKMTAYSLSLHASPQVKE